MATGISILKQDRHLNDEEKNNLENISRDLEFQDRFFKVDGFRCKRCHQIAIIHRIANCGDTLCRKCYEEFFHKRCPVCGKLIFKFNHDAKFEKRLMEQKVFCIKRQQGCNSVISLSGLDKHLKKCKFFRENSTSSMNDLSPMAESVPELSDNVERMKESIKDLNRKLKKLSIDGNRLSHLYDSLKNDVNNHARRMNTDFLGKSDNEQFKLEIMDTMHNQFGDYKEGLHQFKEQLIADQKEEIVNQLVTFQNDFNAQMMDQFEELNQKNSQQLDEIDKLSALSEKALKSDEKFLFELKAIINHLVDFQSQQEEQFKEFKNEYLQKVSEILEKLSDSEQSQENTRMFVSDELQFFQEKMESHVASLEPGLEFATRVQEMENRQSQMELRLQQCDSDNHYSESVRNLMEQERSYNEGPEIENVVTGIVNNILQQHDTTLQQRILNETENIRISLFQQPNFEEHVSAIVCKSLNHQELVTQQKIFVQQEQNNNVQLKTENSLSAFQEQIDNVVRKLESQTNQKSDLEDQISKLLERTLQKNKTEMELLFKNQIKVELGKYFGKSQERMEVMERKIEEMSNNKAIITDKQIKEQVEMFLNDYHSKMEVQVSEKPLNGVQMSMIKEILEKQQCHNFQEVQGVLKKQMDTQLRKYNSEFDKKLKDLDLAKQHKQTKHILDNTVHQVKPSTSRVEKVDTSSKIVLSVPRRRHNDDDDIKFIQFTWIVDQMKELLGSNQHTPIVSCDIPDPHHVFDCKLKANLEIRSQTNNILLWVEFVLDGNNLNKACIFDNSHYVQFILLDQITNSSRNNIVLSYQPPFRKNLMPKALVALPTKVLKAANNCYIRQNTIKIGVSLDPLTLLYKTVANKIGVLIFKVDKYTERKLDEINGIVPCVYSDSFYTSEKGYRVHAKLFLNGHGKDYRGKFLSVYIGFLVGEWDRELSIPTKYSLSFNMLPKEENFSSLTKPSSSSNLPKTSTVNVSKIVNTALLKGFNASLPRTTKLLAAKNKFGSQRLQFNTFVKKIEDRIFDEKIPYVGFSNFCRQYEVENFYLKDDCLTIKVEVTIK